MVNLVSPCFRSWLLVGNWLMESSTPPAQSWDPETSYHGISSYHNNRMGIGLSAMKGLRTPLAFTQLRFHCRKQHGRTFHVTLVANSTGEAGSNTSVIRRTYVPLLAIRSRDWMTITLSWPGSVIGGAPTIMGNGENVTPEGKEWCTIKPRIYIPSENQWDIVKDWLCDDTGSSGVFVR